VRRGPNAGNPFSVHGSPSRDFLSAVFDPAAVAELLGARVAGEVAVGPTITRGVDSSSRERVPVLISRPHRRLGSMLWGIGVSSYLVGIHMLAGLGEEARCYRSRRCALVLTGYDLDANTSRPLRWSGPPTLFAGIYEMHETQGPRCSLLVIDRAPVPLTSDEAEEWNLRRENVAIEDAITIEKVNEILRWPR
jgi:hypothetical protein